MLLRCMAGVENWRGHSAKFHGFLSPTNGDAEAHLLLAGRDPSSGVTTTRSGDRLPAKAGYDLNVVGYWSDNAHEVAEGTICKIFGFKSGAGFTLGPTGGMASCYIRMREGAALRRIKMRLSSDPKARYAVAVASGRFDVLTAEEASLYGIRVLPAFKAQCSHEAQARLFTHETVEPEINPRVRLEPRVVAVAGQAPVTIPVRRRVRPVHF